MRHRRTTLLVSIAILLGACATPGSIQVEHPAPLIPALAADLEHCRQAPVAIPDRKLTAGEVERMWKTDRARLSKVNACFNRVVCQYHDVRREFGKVEDEPACQKG